MLNKWLKSKIKKKELSILIIIVSLIMFFIYKSSRVLDDCEKNPTSFECIYNVEQPKSEKEEIQNQF